MLAVVPRQAYNDFPESFAATIGTAGLWPSLSVRSSTTSGR
jgi:hypothetical protein